MICSVWHRGSAVYTLTFDVSRGDADTISVVGHAAMTESEQHGWRVEREKVDEKGEQRERGKEKQGECAFVALRWWPSAKIIYVSGLKNDSKASYLGALMLHEAMLCCCLNLTERCTVRLVASAYGVGEKRKRQRSSRVLARHYYGAKLGFSVAKKPHSSFEEEEEGAEMETSADELQRRLRSMFLQAGWTRAAKAVQ